jgi:hypothetical protein
VSERIRECVVIFKMANRNNANLSKKEQEEKKKKDKDKTVKETREDTG